MVIVFSVLLIIVGVLMIFAVLIQNSKGGGLAANFASGNQTFGVRQTANFIEKFTWYLVVALFVFCFSATASISGDVVKDNRRSVIQERIPTFTPGVFPVTGSAESESDSVESAD